MLHFSLKSDITLSLNHFSGSSSFAFSISILSYSTPFLFLQQDRSLTISGLFNSLAPLSSTSGFGVAVLFSFFRSHPNHLLIKTFLRFLFRVAPSSLLLSVPQVFLFFTTSAWYCIYHFMLLCVHCWCFFPSPHPQLDHNLRPGKLLAIFYWCVSRA